MSITTVNKKKEMRRELFVAEYVRNGGDGAKAMLATNKSITTNNSAGVAAYRLLSEDKTHKSIAEMLPTDVTISRIIRKGIATETPDIMSWGEKHKLIETVLKLKGYLGDRPHNVNIGLVIDTNGATQS